MHCCQRTLHNHILIPVQPLYVPHAPLRSPRTCTITLRHGRLDCCRGSRAAARTTTCRLLQSCCARVGALTGHVALS
jgi:hypothetical protein